MKKTIILVGSPKPDPDTSSSFFIANAMKSGMTEACDILAICKEEQAGLISKLAGYDVIVLVTPNYIHSLPAPVLQFLYSLQVVEHPQAFGVIVQSGYPETKESEYIRRYLDTLIPSLGYHYLGCKVMGDCAGFSLAPKFFKSKIPLLAELGRRLETTGLLDEVYMRETKLIEYDTLPDKLVKRLNFLNAIGIGKMTWIVSLRKHKAYVRRFDKPFINEP